MFYLSQIYYFHSTQSVLLARVEPISYANFSYYSIPQFLSFLPITPPLLPYYALNILILRVELFTYTQKIS